MYFGNRAGAGVFIRTDPAAASPPYFQELLPKAAVASEPAQKLEARTAIMLQRSVYDGLRDLNVRGPHGLATRHAQPCQPCCLLPHRVQLPDGLRSLEYYP